MILPDQRRLQKLVVKAIKPLLALMRMVVAAALRAAHHLLVVLAQQHSVRAVTAMAVPVVVRRRVLRVLRVRGAAAQARLMAVALGVRVLHGLSLLLRQAGVRVAPAVAVAVRKPLLVRLAVRVARAVAAVAAVMWAAQGVMVTSLSFTRPLPSILLLRPLWGR
jgi:hypothetical protein